MDHKQQKSKNQIMSIKEMCDVMEISFPSRLSSIKNRKISHIALIANHIQSGSAYFICNDKANVKKCLDTALQKNASVIFIQKKLFISSGLTPDSYPVIFTDHWLNSLSKLFAAIRSSYSYTSVAITGTVGKTTTKELLSYILNDKKQVFCNNGNRNSFLSVAKHITEELTKDTKVYIQEIGAGTPRSIEKSASMLCPDIFVILNVKNHHLNTYKTFDNLFQDKTSVDNHMPDHGTVIVNYDDEALANHHFRHNVISFGIHTTAPVDYRAENIVERNGKLKFDIVHDGTRTPVYVNILGQHNIYNILAAYITAKMLSVPSEEIANRLKDYSTSGIRQNYKNIGGYHLYVDCYNVAFDSIQAGLESMINFDLAPGAKRYAVIGGENKLGPDSARLSFEFGQAIANSNIDHFYCFGQNKRTEEALNIYGDARSVCDGINSVVSGKAEFITDSNVLINLLKKEIHCGDIVFFKGIYLLDMPYIIDMVFGSSFTAQSEHYTKDAVFKNTWGYQFKKLPIGNTIELSGSIRKHHSVRIPSKAFRYEVYHISENAFANDSFIKRIKFGKHVMHIHTGAFQSCTSITSLHIPSNIRVINDYAFAGCSKLSKVNMDTGIRHLGENAFKDCINLNHIVLPDSIGYIAESAFAGCSKLHISCKKNSYAHRFAEKNHLQYTII